MAAEKGPGWNYRGGLFDQIDVPALVSLVLSCLGFLLLALWLRPSHEESAQPEQKLEALSERMARILMPLKPPGPPPKTRSATAARPRATPPSEAGRGAQGRIQRSRQRLDDHLRETGERVSRTAVLSILSSKRAGGSNRGRRGTGSSALGFGNLENRLSSLDGLTRYEERGSGTAGGASGDPGPATADANPLFNKFATARRGAAAKIGSLEFERPQLLGGGAKQAGGRQLQSLSTFISRNQTAIRLLYEERLKINPALEGKVTVVLVIEENGRVSSARVAPEETTLRDAEFQEEILRRMRRWIFPAFRGGAVELKSPFVFKPL